MAVLTAGQVAWAAQQGGFSGQQIPLFTAIAAGESSWDTTARGHYVENGVTHYVYGLWQISDVHKELMQQYDWTNPVDNARMAKKIYDTQGLRAWEVYTNGSYLQDYGKGLAGAANPTPIEGNVGGGGVAQATQAGFVDDTITGVGTFFDKIQSGWFWLRVGEIVGGVVLLVVGLSMMLGGGLGKKLTKGFVGIGESGGGALAEEGIEAI